PYATATVAVKPFGTADFFFGRSAPRRQHLKAMLRAQCRFPGQGDDHDEWPKDAVEANLSVLRERIAALRMKERQRQMEDRGDVNSRHFPGRFPAAVKRRRRRREDGEGNVIMGVVAVVSSTLGLTWLAGTGLLCVVSFLSHHFGKHF
ncbi:unnamed protein product, partial [Linum tenue]